MCHYRGTGTESYRLQGTFQTHYSAVFVRLHTDEGLVGTGESLVSAAQTEIILKRMIGRSPVEYWQDDSIQGVVMAVHDILGQASGMSVARLLSPSPKTRIEHTWWTHCLPPDLMAAGQTRRQPRLSRPQGQGPFVAGSARASCGDVRRRTQGVPFLG